MIRIDDSLLEEIGLHHLPEAERKALLSQIYKSLEERVGVRLAEQMSEDQLSEFERFVDGDEIYIQQFLNLNRPSWQDSESYQTAFNKAQEDATKTGRPFNELSVKAEFAALSWLENNFPNYKDVVAEELEKLKAEIKKDAEKIVEAVSQQQHIQDQGENLQQAA